jgi:hypothetical protein
MPPACQWFHHDEEIARAFPFVLVIHPLRLTRFNEDGRVDIGMQQHWFFIQADRWVLRVIRFLIEVKHIFHGSDKLASH